MIRGSTPTHNFSLPIDANLIEDLEIVYQQGGVDIIRRTKKDCSIEGNVAKVKLSQQETLSLHNSSRSVKLQMRVKTTGGDVLVSDVLSVSADECLFNEVI